MRDEAAFEDYDGDERASAGCPVPEWALRPLAIALPVVAVCVALWAVLHR